MRHGGVRRWSASTAACGFLLAALSACGAAGVGQGDGGRAGAGAEGARTAPSTTPTAPTTRIPDVGDRLQGRIPSVSRQVLAVYGDGEDSADATAVLYVKRGPTWEPVRNWPAHNGKKGWTADHREGDNRSPVGVFTLTDAGGVLADPGARLSYTQADSFAAPREWERSHWHDFDYVIAIDYNRLKGNPPDDPTRPGGEEKGGGIWLHMDHGSGTSACVSLSRAAMEYLLRTLDPDRHPVVVMGDRAALKA
ncbi:L,D-transpeptidase family protein [Streptomyces sp. NBC_01275]|uniref:L,D-transpeptidase family protein n=1 Tax=Streptomyces sp. NBC_01275 TaxID=2903807 RepID=UPI002255446F|nr:L,D-transpeptidase family protein [Streptomyces sp. NBC_01275]MCX4759967.1 L,D-transpeptidase family protein [Streptomyces sp. NBC_01275]